MGGFSLKNELCIGTWVGKSDPVSESISWWCTFLKCFFKCDFCLNSVKHTEHLNVLVRPSWWTPWTCRSKLPFLLNSFPQRLQSKLIPRWSAWICMSLPPVDLKSLPQNLHGKVFVLVWTVSMCLSTFDGLEKDFPQVGHLYIVSWGEK